MSVTQTPGCPGLHGERPRGLRCGRTTEFRSLGLAGGSLPWGDAAASPLDQLRDLRLRRHEDGHTSPLLAWPTAALTVCLPRWTGHSTVDPGPLRKPPDLQRGVASPPSAPEGPRPRAAPQSQAAVPALGPAALRAGTAPTERGPLDPWPPPLRESSKEHGLGVTVYTG